MSKLYGTLRGDGRSGPRTRCALRETWASAQSWEGSITVGIEIVGDSEHRATIMVGTGSTTGGNTLWHGRLSDLINSPGLAPIGKPVGFRRK